MTNMTISKDYFLKEVKPNVNLMQLEGLVDVAVITNDQSIDKENFVRDSILLPNDGQLDKLLQNICQKLSIRIEDNIEQFITKDLTPKIMSDLPYERINSHLLNSNRQDYEEEMIKFLKGLDYKIFLTNISLQARYILCDSASYKYFRESRYFKPISNLHGALLSKYYIYLPELDKIKFINKDLIQKQVRDKEAPAIFMIIAYPDSDINPIKFQITLPRRIDERRYDGNIELEYYYKISFIKIDGLEAEKKDNMSVPVLKRVTKQRTLALPILIGLDESIIFQN